MNYVSQVFDIYMKYELYGCCCVQCEFIIVGNLIDVYYYEKVLIYLCSVLDYVRQFEEVYMIVVVYYNVGYCKYSLGDYCEVEGYFKIVVVIFKEYNFQQVV